MIVIISSLLIISLWVLTRAITIEKLVRNQFQLPRNDAKHHAVDRNLSPKFENKEDLSSDLSQLYFYHDCVWRNSLVTLPHHITKKVHYRKNSSKDPPIGIFMVHENLTYLILRSTKTLPEKLKDIDIVQSMDSHKGIRDIYNSISLEIIDSLKDCERVIIFGHSLGGALVDMLCYDLMHKYPEIWDRCISFSSGSPRVFSPSKSDSFSYHDNIHNYMKIINEADIVPFHPTTATGVDGILSTGKKYFYKSFSNKDRIYRFNYVMETQMLDSHLSSTYSRAIWHTPPNEFPVIMNSTKSV